MPIGSCSAVGDINLNGRLHLLTVNISSNTIAVMPGNGTGDFGARTDDSTGLNAGAVKRSCGR